MKRKIDVLEYSGKIMKALSKGVLLTVKGDEKVNSMVISWGALAIEWNKPILDKTMEFTVNIPLEKMDPKIFSVCGMKSGRNIDKVKEAEMTLVEPEVVSVPAIKELPITLECKVLYKKTQELKDLPEEIVNRNYPKDIDGYAVGSNRDPHTAYYGEIVAAYIIED